MSYGRSNTNLEDYIKSYDNLIHFHRCSILGHSTNLYTIPIPIPRLYISLSRAHKRTNNYKHYGAHLVAIHNEEKRAIYKYEQLTKENMPSKFFKEEFSKALVLFFAKVTKK